MDLDRRLADGAERREARRAAIAQRRQARARTGGSSGPEHRRRGAELEGALLEAVWDQLMQSGYEGLTYERVAYRAGTSRSVVYRRWPTKRELALAAIAHQGAIRAPLDAPDTGTLRGDLLVVLRAMNEQRAEAMVLFGTRLGTFYQEAGISPSVARQYWLGDRSTAMRQILDRAVARGEVDPSRVTPRSERVAADLLRHEVLMRYSPATDRTIVEIVDEVAVPLLTGRAPAPPTEG